jgi:hypothetical protein
MFCLVRGYAFQWMILIQVDNNRLDYYELAILLGACFLVNYVTADAKTNWVS